MIIRIVLIAVVTVSAFSIMYWYDRALCRWCRAQPFATAVLIYSETSGKESLLQNKRGGRVKFYCLAKLEGTAPRSPKVKVAALCSINKSLVAAAGWNRSSLHNYKISR